MVIINPLISMSGFFFGRNFPEWFSFNAGRLRSYTAALSKTA